MDEANLERMPPPSILLGINQYHRRHADKLPPLVQTAPANTRTPCSGLCGFPVTPNLITSSGPGNLLTLHNNIGNVVCNPGQDASVESALAFALNGLAVDSIVICGHSNCGALKAVITDADNAVRPGSPWEAPSTRGSNTPPRYTQLLDRLL